MRITAISPALKSALVTACAYLASVAGLPSQVPGLLAFDNTHTLNTTTPTQIIQTQAQQKVDPAGTWAWTTPSTPAGQTRSTPARTPQLERKTTLRFKLDGDRLTGTIFTQLSQPRTNAVPIMDAKLDGDVVSFTVSRELNGKHYVQKFSGKVSGDTIKGKIEFERDGKPESREWVAHRATGQAGEQSSDRGRAAKRGPGNGVAPQFPNIPKPGL